MHASITGRTLARLSAVLAVLAATVLVVPPAAATYPGADGRIAFVRANQIYTMTPAGGSILKLTSADKNLRPRWSPNGQRIAYVHESADGSRDLWVMQANGSNKRQVTRLGQVTGAAWSPDGTRLVFGGWSAADSHMVLQSIRSVAPFGTPTPLTASYISPGSPERLWVDLDGTPTWSPDGGRIAWYSHYAPESPDNYVLELDRAAGTYEVVIAIGGSCCGFGYFGDPNYSPSGQLAYTSKVDPAPVTIEAPSITNPRAGDQQPAWAPSGGRVAFMNNSTGAARIVVSRLDGSARRVLTTGYQPDWQPVP